MENDKATGQVFASSVGNNVKELKQAVQNYTTDKIGKTALKELVDLLEAELNLIEVKTASTPDEGNSSASGSKGSCSGTSFSVFNGVR